MLVTCWEITLSSQFPTCNHICLVVDSWDSGYVYVLGAHGNEKTQVARLTPQATVPDTKAQSAGILGREDFGSFSNRHVRQVTNLLIGRGTFKFNGIRM